MNITINGKTYTAKTEAQLLALVIALIGQNLYRPAGRN